MLLVLGSSAVHTRSGVHVRIDQHSSHVLGHRCRGGSGARHSSRNQTDLADANPGRRVLRES